MSSQQQRSARAAEMREKMDGFGFFHSQETVTTYAPTDSESRSAMSGSNHLPTQQTAGEVSENQGRKLTQEELFAKMLNNSTEMFQTIDFDKADPNNIDDDDDGNRVGHAAAADPNCEGDYDDDDDDDDDDEDGLPTTMFPPNAVSNTKRNVSELRPRNNGNSSSSNGNGWDAAPTTRSMVSSSSSGAHGGTNTMDQSSHTMQSGVTPRTKSTGGVPVTNGTAQQNLHAQVNVSDLCLEVPNNTTPYEASSADFFLGTSNHSKDFPQQHTNHGSNKQPPFSEQANNSGSGSMMTMFMTGDDDNGSIDSDITGLTGVFSSHQDFMMDADWDFDDAELDGSGALLVDDHDLMVQKRKLYQGVTTNNAGIQVQAIPPPAAAVKANPGKRNNSNIPTTTTTTTATATSTALSSQNIKNNKYSPIHYGAIVQGTTPPAQPKRGHVIATSPQHQQQQQQQLLFRQHQQQQQQLQQQQQQQQQQLILQQQQMQQQQRIAQSRRMGPRPNVSPGIRAQKSSSRLSVGASSTHGGSTMGGGSSTGYSTRSPMPNYATQKHMATNSALDDSRTGSNHLRVGSVHFSTVQIRRYERILSDNPSAVSGPSIGIGWRFRQDPPFSLRDYERYRGPPRPAAAILLNREERENLLLGLGYTRKHLAAAVRANNRAKNQRRQTVQNLRADRMEEALEGTKATFRSLFGKSNTNNTYHHQQQQQQQQQHYHQQHQYHLPMTGVTQQQQQYQQHQYQGRSAY